MIIPDYSTLTGGAVVEKSIAIHYPEFHQYILNNYPEIPWKEKLYWYYNKLQTRPVCQTCGKATEFVNIKEGYRQYCCRTCMNRDPKKREQVKQTNIERYGGVAPACSAEVKNKAKRTNLKLYGVENAMQNKDIAKKSHDTNIERYGGCGNASVVLLDRYKQTNFDRYGAENVMQSQFGKTKIQDTLRDRYGVSHQSKIPTVIDKIIATRKAHTCEKYEDVLSISNEDIWTCKCPHPDCNKCQEKIYIVRGSIYRDRKRDHTEPCTKLLKECDVKTSGTSIELFVRNILDEIHISHVDNDRSSIKPKELDILIPNKKIAIECNGIQSHCYPYKEPSYHYRKYIACQKEGLQLLTIWQDQIERHPDIVKSIILSKLGIYDERIYARKCDVVEIDPKTCCQFLDQHHIQGRTSAKVHLGLKYRDVLVGVMTFGLKRGCSGDNKAQTDVWELSRFCVKQNTQIVGGAAKLISYFIKHYNPKTIYSFSSNDISDGSLYKALGFIENGQNQSYWYVDIKSMKRYHRSSFTKDAIVRRGWKDSKEGWIESEVVTEHGYFQIFDSGQTKWVLNL